MHYTWDHFRLDLDGFRLERDGVPVPLEPKAFNLLALLVTRPGHVFTKQELFDTLWADTNVTDHALTRVVSQLRRGLGDEAREARYLETVPTRGYRWIGPAALTATALPPPPDAAAARAEPAPDPPPPRRARWPAPAVAAALVAAIAGAWTLGGLHVRNVTPAAGTVAAWSGGPGWSTPVQLTTHPGLDLHPALSPVDGALAFASDRTGAFEIFVRDRAGAAADTPLTTDGGQNVQPAWSPDGREIAYHSSRRGGIWVIPAHGGPARQVAAHGSHPAWSPDGQRLVFQSDEFTDVTPSGFAAQNGSTLWLVDRDGRAPRALTQAGEPIGGHALPAWTGDGRRVAFMVFDGGPNDGLWILDLDGGPPRLLDAGRGLYEFAFVPGDTAIYAAGGGARIVRLAFDAASGTSSGGRAVLAVPGVPGVRGLTVAADGRSLSFSAPTLTSQIWTQPIAAGGAPRGPARALTTDTSRRNSMAVVAPDGQRIAYMSSRQGAPPNVWVMARDGSGRVPLTPEDSADGEPAWFADGRRLAYRSNRGGRDGIWVVDVETRREAPWIDVATARRAAPEPLASGWPGELRFAPDMAHAAFSLLSPQFGRRLLYVTPLDRYAPRVLTSAAVSAGYPAWSPDGHAIAVELKDGSSTHAAVVDAGSGRLRQLTTDRGQTWIRSWSPDGRALAAATFRDGAWSLRRIDVATGAQAVITPPAEPGVYVRYPEWSPANDMVVFERGELRGNIWTLAVR